MSKPLLYDLFAGAGGASAGYVRAGFDVVGVDVRPQPRYLLSGAREFVQMDAFEFMDRVQRGDFRTPDAIHASPPCQAYSLAAKSQRNSGKEYPDLVAETRELLAASGRHWVIENVPGAPIRADFRLCGCQFSLDLRRERWFETSWEDFQLRTPCFHPYPVVSVVGRGTPTWVRRKLGYNPKIQQYREAMGIDWMNRNELSQAIPPAYTEHIGRQLIASCHP